MSGVRGRQKCVSALNVNPLGGIRKKRKRTMTESKLDSYITTERRKRAHIIRVREEKEAEKLRVREERKLRKVRKPRQPRKKKLEQKLSEPELQL